jgi:hypothetical protein
MVSNAIDIANAIVSELNAETFSQEFTAVRYYLPQTKLENLAELKVSVVPRTITETVSSRESTVGEYIIDVGIQKAIDPAVLAEADELMLLAEEISNFFRLRTLVDYEPANWAGVETTLYSSGELSDLRAFTSIVRLSYRAPRT